MPTDVDPTIEFAPRHIGPSASEQQAMLAELGMDSLEQLIDAVVPASIRSTEPLALPAARSEVETISALRAMADANEVRTSMIGLGYHGTVTPAVITRNILENPAWYTAYTPYQPEISQGRLEMLLNYQTMVSDLAGREIANASLLDEATAAAEAMTLLHRVQKNPGNRFVVDADALPQTIAVMATRAEPLGIELVVADLDDPDVDLDDVYGVLVQYPGASGRIRDLAPIVAAHHDAGRLVAVAADLLACTLFAAPGDADADVVVGSAQRFGVPMGFGGPHAGYMAVREEYRRSLPGRLVGMSIDDAGSPALRLALQTREQHIRREKATSNICTAQVLLAVMAGAYAVYHGPAGLRSIAARIHTLATTFAVGLAEAGIDATDAFFDTVTATVPGRAAAIVAAAADAGIDLRLMDPDHVAVAFDETHSPALVDQVLAFFDASAPTGDVQATVPAALARSSDFCTHPVFAEHRSETSMLRYLRRLADRDLALDRTMIPLGSCTMKLNATTEMVAVTWPEFANIHPFAPAASTAGYRRLITELEAALCEVTGYDAVSLQPNAGSQGEFAGLLAIRAFHHANGDQRRNVCLIPQSAHGTNAASAAMAGMRVVVVDCDDNGDVDVDDLEKKCIDAGDELGALMVTYPSTHGVFEEGIGEICDLIHRHGGQVYLDGANLNALVGLAKPGRFGADVSHLNLHKTFCIPHGGGGPGVGPVAVRAHLAPYLPNHPLVADAGPATGIGPVSAAPWGSASILPISWAYVALMGPDGLTEASKVAILGANVIARRLAPHYPVLYTGEHGLVAHECIIDLRPITKATGVSVDDVAKRLMDFGFHAPTMSFPVAGTLMIEPTESENLAEIDRFCDAMIAIRAEIDRVATGEWHADESPLRRAPHTAAVLTADEWDRPYTRSEAAYPTGTIDPDKYWPPVGRIDGAHGDKHLVCSCPDIEDFR